MAPAFLNVDFLHMSDDSSPTPSIWEKQCDKSSDSETGDDRLMNDKTEPVAVIGYSLKFPQDAISSEAFWQMLIEGRSARTDIPKERFNMDAFHHPDVRRHDSLNVRGAHFLEEDIAVFDAPFFSITPAEAASMDPQQRGLLETTYRALENAGIPMKEVAGTKTSVHVGSFTHDWQEILRKDPLMQANYAATGSEFSILANRLSWFYDLVGPSVSLDTACSSSLMALHLACQSLHSGEATMGLVCGSNLLLDPGSMTGMANLGMLSPEGKCYSFDERANGYARGEGFGVVVIKRLSEALKNGDTIRAIIRATGSNQDGRTAGITQPSGDAQERLIRDTYQAAGLERKVTRYFEAHGTGTQAGDPIEAQAIASAFEGQRSQGEPLYVGSVKTNVGHLEGTSGIAGLIKAMLILEKGLIPPNIWFEKVNPRILAEEWNIKFPVENTPWPTTGLRRASVNSFGFGGSNVHAVLDDVFHYLKLRHLSGTHFTSELPPFTADGSGPQPRSASPERPVKEETHKLQEMLFVWSAADEAGLKRLNSLYANHLSRPTIQQQSKIYLENLEHTLSAKRSSLRWRCSVVARSIQGLQQALNTDTPKSIRSTSTQKIAYIFTGQGAQWHAMGRELEIFPIFRDSIRDSQAILTTLGCGWSLLNELWKSEKITNIHKPAYSQPICTVLQIALVNLLRSWGIRPSAVIGHSSGEIAAAYCSGALSKTSAIEVAFYRGIVAARLIKCCQQQGAMMSVSLSEKEAEPYLTRMAASLGNDKVAIACVNSPQNVTLSGGEQQIDALKLLFDQEKVVARKLKVNVAYHSRAMDDVAAEYLELIKDLSAGEPLLERPAMFSSVTGAKITNREVGQAEYWVKNLTSQVKFSEALSHLCTQSSKSLARKLGARKDGIAVTDLLELGPHGALQRPIKDILNASTHGRTMTYDSLLTRGISATTSALTAIGRLHCLGYSVKLAAVNDPIHSHSKQILPDLPEYPFNHAQSYWIESRLSKNFRFRKQPRHELLGTPVPDWNAMEARWRHTIRYTDSPWIIDHKVNGATLYPAAGLLVMAIEAARQLSQHKSITGYRLLDVSFPRALMSMSRADGFETQIYLRPLRSNDDKASSESSEFRVYTYENGDWAENCRGTVAVEYEPGFVEVDGGKEAQLENQHYKEMYDTGYTNTCRKQVGSRKYYERLESMGLSYGPSFQVLNDVRYSRREAIGKVELRKWTTSVDESEYQDHVIHPTALDGILQLSFAAILQGGEVKSPTMVPELIQHLWISSQGLSLPGNDSVKAYAKSDHRDSRTAHCDILALDRVSDEPKLVLKGLQTKVVESHRPTSSSDSAGWKRLCYSFDWRPDINLLSNAELQEYCRASIPPELPPDKFIEDMEFMCYFFVKKTLEALASRELTNLKPHFVRYIDWMERQSERYDRSEFIHWRPDWPKLRHDEHYCQEVISRVEKFSAEGKLYAETGKNLLGILEGRVDALDLLFTGELATEYYKEANGTLRGLKTIEPYLDALAHTNPAFKILEIGAGTGSSTAFVLETLSRHGEAELGVPRYGTYTFTDISPGFFEKARERFKEHTDRMVFTTLNIEQDPLQQGFQENEYDMIIAANVLHATASLSETLQNSRKLLKPGGKLILSELYNHEVIRAGFAFGLLPGWWRSTEGSRQWGPLISETEWHSALCANGFSGTDLAFHDYDDPRNHMGNTMISTAVATPPKFPSNTEVLIIANQASQLQHQLAFQIKSQLVSANDMASDVIHPNQISSTHLKQKFCIFLPEIEDPFLQSMSEEDYTRLQAVMKSGKGLLWTTQSGGHPRKPEADMILGLSRVVRSENSNARVVTLALQDTQDVISIAHSIVQIFKNTFYSPPEQCETEYEERGGKLCTNRLVEANYLNDYIYSKNVQSRATKQGFGKGTRALTLNIGSLGLLDTMEYIEDLEIEAPLASDEVEVKVKAVGINFKDVLIALGRLSEGGLGNECAGVVTRAGAEARLLPGDRVCVCALGTYKTYVRSKAILAFKIPDTMSFCEAAAIPVVYTTAYQALVQIARLTSGESILIHSGAGGTGQAAIQLAKHLQAEIFVTVGSEEKKKLVMDLYGITEDHIFSSRGMSFTKGVKRMTKGQGVDVILNSLAGESLQGSWDCLAPFGRFVEIGKKDILGGNKLSMSQFNENRTFAAVNMTHMISERPELIRKTMEAVLALARDDKIGTAKPLHVYNNSQIEEAFRYLQGGKNTGKTILELNEDDVVPVVPSSRPTYSFRDDMTYLISGGLGGLGKRIALWMVDRGARNLILLSRSGARSEDTKAFMDEVKAMDVDVATPPCDISDKHSLASVLAECAKTMPPIVGCIQASMVLEDSIFENMTLTAFNAALAPKVAGSRNLHTLLPRDLDHFILLSSASGVTGVRSQANYAAGNTYQDALARHRVMNGQKAVSLDLGMIGSIGYVAERPKALEGAKRMGFAPIEEAELLALLDYHCDPHLEVLSATKCQVITGLAMPDKMANGDMEEVYWMRKSQFRGLHNMSRSSSNNASSTDPDNTTAATPLSTLLSTASSAVEAADIVTDALVRKLSRILSMPLEDIDATKPMHTFGVDSLVAVEVRNWFKKETGSDVTVFEILGNQSLAEVCAGVGGKGAFGKADALEAEEEEREGEVGGRN